MHLNSELIFIRHARGYFVDNMKVLEIGPAGIPSRYQKLIGNETITWHTLDLYESYEGITYVAENEYEYDIEDDSYDIVISGQVIEHVKKIWIWLRELKRVVKPGGHVIIINPVSWPYHAHPVDCWRIFPDGMKALCDHCDLRIVFCQYESIESEHFSSSFSPTVPGQSYALNNQRVRIRFVRIWNAFLYVLLIFRKFRIPIEVAYDTVTIAQKGQVSTQS